MHARSVILRSAFALLMLAAVRAEAEYDVFIKFGAPANGAVAYVGESHDPQFPGSNGWSEVISVGQSILNPTTIGSGSGGGSGGQAEFGELSFLKPVDRGSPVLFKSCAVGGHYNAVQVVFRERGLPAPGLPPFSLARLGLVYITRIKTTGAEGAAVPAEQITLVYGSLQWTHRSEETEGVFGSITAHWDVVLNVGGPGPFPGLTLTPSSLPGGLVGVAYSQSFATSGGNAPYAYQLQSGVLPAGLTLSSAGMLSGIPASVGTNKFKVAGVDINASFAERNYTVVITDPCGQPPQLTDIRATNTAIYFRLQGTVGCQYQIQSAPAVNGPWSDNGTAFILSGSGVFDFADTNVPDSRFYRSIVVR